jgi:hypothetical protein
MDMARAKSNPQGEVGLVKCRRSFGLPEIRGFHGIFDGRRDICSDGTPGPAAHVSHN